MINDEYISDYIIVFKYYVRFGLRHGTHLRGIIFIYWVTHAVTQYLYFNNHCRLSQT